MWFEKKVSRKEFEDLQERNTVNETLIGAITTDLLKAEQRIAKLEASNNCRDGKHEWVGVDTSTMVGLGSGIYHVTTSTPDAACKHCAIKKDDWEKTGTKFDEKPTIGEKVTIRTAPQPKRRKGKK